MSEQLPKCSIYKMTDNAEDYRVHKRSAFDLPMRLLIIGKSQLSGKTNTVGNLVLRPFGQEDAEGKQFYKDDFSGDDIYIVCPSTLVDHKWRSIVKGKLIPPSNIFESYDEIELEKLYDKLEKEHYDNPRHKLVIFDDVSFSGDLKHKMNGVMSKFACNSRHFLISIIVTAQKYSDVSTALRENATGMMLYACSQKQMDLIYNDIGECAKNEFMTMFRKCTHQKHSCMIVNYSNDPSERFLNQYFQHIT